MALDFIIERGLKNSPWVRIPPLDFKLRHYPILQVIDAEAAIC